jgi:hypothetical protein
MTSRGACFFFAHCITIANSNLKTSLNRCTEDLSGIEDEVVAGDLNTPAHQDDDLHKERHKGWL